ncbi:telomere stability and silencing-domain-containing protein [Phlebopus sp. FC_14]|nr:telomere stability and silencing-domain-containing protein [Phlebopus sp. FC_14]
MSTNVIFSTFPPFPTLSLLVPLETCIDELYELLCDRYPHLPASDALRISPHSGCVNPDTHISELRDESSNLVTLRLVPRLRGGKGGFGSQLRAAGGRMSSQKTSNNDSCRDLSGRRLSTIKTAKRLVDYMENEEERKKAAAEAKRAKLESLEKKIASASTEPEAVAGKKHRFDDTEYLEESREIVDNVKSAVSAGLLKKKKKAKTTHLSSSPESSSTPKDKLEDAVGAATITDKVIDSAVSVSVPVGLASA